MRFTDRTDYALRVLLHLATLPPDAEPVPVRELAARYQVSESHLAKCVQALSRHALVRTTAGRRGGVQLARDPDGLTIGEVVRALEPMAVVPCFAGDQSCPLLPRCGLIGPIERAWLAFLAVLDDTTLAEASLHRRPDGSL